MPIVEQDDFPDEKPTSQNPSSGAWIVAVDRGQKLIEDVIAQLESGGDVEHAIEQLRIAHGLVNGRLAR